MVRLLAIVAVAIVSVTLTAILYFPYTVMKMKNIFDAYTYLNSFFLFMLPSMILAILAVSAFYQIFYRVDLSVISFIAFMLLSFNKWFSNNNIIRWLNPPIPVFSDYFSNSMVFRLMSHNRIFWFFILSGIWLMTLLCVRRYGKGVFGSISYNLRKGYIPFLAAVLISGGYYAYINQPYIDQNSLMGPEVMNNNQLELLHTDLEVILDGHRGSLLGEAIYYIQNMSNGIQECAFSINRGYTIYRIMANEKEIEFRNLNDDKGYIVFNVPNSEEIKLSIEYGGTPQINKEFSDILFQTNISNKYIDLGSKELFPQLKVENSKNDSKITGRITMPAELIPVVNGTPRKNNGVMEKGITDTVELLSDDGKNTTWLVNANSNSFDLMAGDYVIKKLGDENMPIEFYYSRKIEANMKNVSAEKVMNSTINYCTAHYGKLHNVSKNSPLKVIQGTVFYFGGRGFQNFSIMDETYFSDKNLSDKSKGSSSAEVLAHEIIHQWWGVKCVELGEGLTVYTTYRVMKEKYGEEYAQKNYVDKWKELVKYENNNFYNRHPEYLDILPEKYAAEIRGGNRTVHEYAKMPLQILKATELVGGEANMDKILAKLYEDTKTKDITWQDFLDACELKEEELKIEQTI